MKPISERVNQRRGIHCITYHIITYCQCENLEPSNEEPEGGIKSILDLDAISLCRSLVEFQEVLDHHGVSAFRKEGFY